jgi:hypothetical protein
MVLFSDPGSTPGISTMIHNCEEQSDEAIS